MAVQRRYLGHAFGDDLGFDLLERHMSGVLSILIGLLAASVGGSFFTRLGAKVFPLQ